MNMRQVLLTTGCIGLNLILAKLTVLFSLPVYFDSVATIISAALLPWFLTVVVALGTSFVGSIVIDPNLIAYCGTQLSVALVAIFCFRAGLFYSWSEALLSGLILAVCAVLVSAPVTVILFGGVTWSETNSVTSLLLDSGKDLWLSVTQGAVLVECIDKISASLLAFLLLKHFPYLSGKAEKRSENQVHI